MGEEGSTDFYNAYSIYAVLLTIATAGLPVALSKTVSEANTLGNQNQKQRVFRVALSAFLTIGIVFFTAYLLTQYVSLGSLLAAVSFGVTYIVLYHDRIPVMIGGLFMSALTVFMHRGNLSRLLKGQERKTNLFAKGKKQ